LPSSAPVVVLLNEINNPSNLGAVIRTAEAAGIVGVIISEDSADVFLAEGYSGVDGLGLSRPDLEDAD